MILVLALLAGPAQARVHHHHTRDTASELPKPYFVETGRASFYGSWHDGRMTASGETFDRSDFTAAHRTLPFGTMVQVVNLSNRKTVEVRITDRGPRKPGRIIDVSAAAARELGMLRRGLARVRIRVYRSDQPGP